MIALDMAQILDVTDQLADMIANSELAFEYIESRELMNRDREVQSLIKEFNHKKEAYAEVQRIGRYHPDYKKVRSEVFEMKRTLEQHPLVSRFKQAEKDLDELLYEISQLIAVQVSPNIIVPGGNPYFSGGRCSTGGCGSGGACGCS